MKRVLEFQEDNYNQFINSLNGFKEIFKDTIIELNKQGIGGYTFEDLKQGNFKQLFIDFHKSQQAKNNVTKNMIFDKYLELYGYNSTKLGELETNYKTYLEKEFIFYSLNNSFYSYCHNHLHRDYRIKAFLENAPKTKVFKIFDFVSVKGNDIKFDVSKELFTVYATNQKQLETIENVKEFVRIAKRLEMTSHDILKPLVKYLNHKESSFHINGNKGLSEDLKIINFDYNKILMIEP